MTSSHRPTWSFRALTVVLGLAIGCAPLTEAAAQAAKRGGPKGCLSKAEETAEQVIREGVRLREGALGCDGEPWKAGTKPLWEAVDSQFGPRFAAQTQVRKRAFQREFVGDAGNRLDQWDGRIVMYFRHYPLSGLYCQDVKDRLQQVQRRGWRFFMAQAVKAKDAVKMQYKACD